LQQRHLIANRGETSLEMAAEFPYQCLYPMEVVLWILSPFKFASLSAGFELVNLRSHHVRHILLIFWVS
jgi:hypothetical protein